MGQSRRDFLRAAGGAGLFFLPGVLRGQGFSPPDGVLDVERLIKDCIDAAGKPDAQQQITGLLQRALQDPAAALAALGRPNRSGFEPVYRSSTLTILNAGLAPGLQLAPHNHAMYAVTGVYSGRERHKLWQRNGGTIQAMGERELSAGQVMSYDANAVHSLENPADQFAGAIHIYGGDFLAAARTRWHPETLQGETIDGVSERLMFEEINRRQYGDR
jgi:predicted metal-dependent enzyme (double-stranded beta helix superfamily)